MPFEFVRSFAAQRISQRISQRKKSYADQSQRILFPWYCPSGGARRPAAGGKAGPLRHLDRIVAVERVDAPCDTCHQIGQTVTV